MHEIGSNYCTKLENLHKYKQWHRTKSSWMGLIRRRVRRISDKNFIIILHLVELFYCTINHKLEWKRMTKFKSFRIRWREMKLLWFQLDKLLFVIEAYFGRFWIIDKWLLFITKLNVLNLCILCIMGYSLTFI